MTMKMIPNKLINKLKSQKVFVKKTHHKCQIIKEIITICNLIVNPHNLEENKHNPYNIHKSNNLLNLLNLQMKLII